MATLKDISYSSLPVGFSRGEPAPLDSTQIWTDLEALRAYAKDGKTSYIGQIVQLVDTNAGTATAYIIANAAGDLVEVGAATLGDNASIELYEDENGVNRLRIVGLESAESGAQLVKNANGTVSWVKPDTTTVAGLQSAVATLQNTTGEHETRLSAAESDIDALETKFNNMGGIFNFAGSFTSEQFANMSAEAYDVGDVVLIDGVKEYVCVEGDDSETDEVETKRWEVLGDPSGVTALEGEVETLKTWKTTASDQIATLETKTANAETNISNLTNKDAELASDIAKKASSEDLNAAVARIATNEQAIASIQAKNAEQDSAIAGKASTADVDNKVSDINTAIGKKADQTDLDAAIENMITESQLTDGLSKKIDATTYKAKISDLETAIDNNNSTIADVKKTADGNKASVESINSALGNKAESSTVDAIDTRLQLAEGTIATHNGSISILQGSVTSLQENKVDKSVVTALTERVAVNEEAIASHATDYSALKSRVDGHDTAIAEAKERANKGVADAAAAASAAENAKKDADAAMAKAEGVLGAEGDGATANTVFGVKKAAAAAQTAAETAQSEVDALEGTVADLKQALETADANLDDRIDKIEAVIGGVQGAMHFVGISTKDPSSGKVSIAEKPDYTPADGDVVIYKDAEGNSIEYIYSAQAWVELGDVSAEAKRIEELETWQSDTVTPALNKIPGIEENISGLTTAQAQLASRITTAEEKNGSQDTAISSLNDRLTTAEGTITKNASDIRAELADEATELQNNINAEITERATAVANLQSKIETINNLLTWHTF